MSSLIVQYPVVRALLRRHRAHNLEYAAVAPFQTLMTIFFPATDGYCVNMEQSVDRGAARVDMLIHGLDFDHDTLFMVMIGELKGSYKSPSEGESQLLRRAREAIIAHKLEMIYGFTTLGEAFRFWTVSARNMTLEPLFSETPRGSRSAYVPLDSAEGDCIAQICTYIRENRPLCQAIILPSQDFSVPNKELYGQASRAHQPAEESSCDPDQYISVPSEEYHGESSQNPEISTRFESDNLVTSSVEQPLQIPKDPTDQFIEVEDAENDAEDGPAAGASDVIGTHQGATRKQVTITREEHNFRSDKYLFRKHKRGHIITTRLEDWTKIRAENGREVWYYTENTKYWGYKPR